MIALAGYEPYKRREVAQHERVRVYRNLMRSDGPWYSIMQRGRVVGHSRCLLIERAEFVVREGGRLRALREGVKNVHAFVCGYLVSYERDSRRDATRVRYAPATGFTLAEAAEPRVIGADRVWLDSSGCFALNPR